MAESVSKGFLASLHAERLLRGKQHAKTAPLPVSAAEVSGLATNEASPSEVKPLTKQASLLSFFQKETPAPMAGLPLKRQQELELSNHWAAKEAQRNRVQEYIRACIVYWDCAPPTRPPAGRKTMSTRWNELFVSLIKKELSQAGADLDTPLGPKPAMPKDWNSERCHIRYCFAAPATSAEGGRGSSPYSPCSPCLLCSSASATSFRQEEQ